MKQLFILFNFFFFISNAQVPQLWGLAEADGSNPEGIIFKINGDGTGYSIDDTLSGTNGGTPPGKLIQASNGKLYGMTLDGGTYNFGVIFSYDVFTSTLTKIIDFNNANGKQPYGSLIESSTGKLYGMTQAGGSYGNGVIFSLDPSNNAFSKLYDFSIFSGSIPAGNLTEANNGLLYGMTSCGGTNGMGTLFSFDPVNNTYSNLYNFNGTDGKSPLGSLIQISNGKFYGLTYLGGAYSGGVLFCFNPMNTNYTVYYNFNNSGGRNPMGSLIQANNGKLYGMTLNGGVYNSGVIFTLDTNSNAYSKVFEFTNGGGPNGSLRQASDGNLYGMTENGGSDFLGTIFSFNPANNNFLNIFDFNTSSYGFNPSGDLMELKITTGISTNNHNAFSVFPNPSSGIINLEGIKNTDKITVMNVLGQIIYDYKPGSEETSLRLDKAGIYSIFVKRGIQIYIKRVIIN